MPAHARRNISTPARPGRSPQSPPIASTTSDAASGRSDRIRLQRILADAGVASRRRCEELISSGHVEVNGEVVSTLPAFADPSTDRIKVDGQVVTPGRRARGSRHAGKAESAPGKPVRHLYVMLNKPERVVTTVSDQQDVAGGGVRRTVLDLVHHPSGARLYPVGRLDYETRGLVLLTNDGELANRLTHPRYGVHKTYRAVVKGIIADEAVESLTRGIFLAERKDGKTRGATRTASVQLAIIKRERERTHLDITLAEGRNRQVRRMFAKLGHPVKTLTRIAMGPLQLRGVASGQWRELTSVEVARLRKAGT